MGFQEVRSWTRSTAASGNEEKLELKDKPGHGIDKIKSQRNCLILLYISVFVFLIKYKSSIGFKGMYFRNFIWKLR